MQLDQRVTELRNPAEVFAEARSYIDRIRRNVPEIITGSALLSEKLAECTRRNGRVLTAGNGGSFANAQIIASNLRRNGFRAEEAVQDDVAEIRSLDDFLTIFDTSTKCLTSDDLLIVLSGSGNSPNILHAVQAARSNGTQVFALTGRDGGKLCPLLGASECWIAPSHIMETIEDLHLLVGMTAALPDARERETRIHTVAESFDERFIAAVTKLSGGWLNLVLSEGILLVAGADIASRHLRADAQRGWIGASPIRGVTVPEFFSDNSAMATLNDDGPEHLLVDGLVRYCNLGRPSQALVVHTDESAERTAPVFEILAQNNIGTSVVGTNAESDVNISRFANALDYRWCISHIGHAAGHAIRSHLERQFDTRLFSNPMLTGGRKPRFKELLEIEEGLHRAGTLSRDRVLSVNYGRVYESLSPSLFELSRGYY